MLSQTELDRRDRLYQNVYQTIRFVCVAAMTDANSRIVGSTDNVHSDHQQLPTTKPFPGNSFHLRRVLPKMKSPAWSLSVAVSVWFACSQPTPASTSPLVKSSGGELSGIVRLHSVPVRHFGVTVTRNSAVTSYPQALAVNSADGRFVLSDLPPGSVDIIIAGPGFARHVILGREIVSQSRTDLGVIEVKNGIAIRGSVLDPHGRPVPNAVVRLSQPGYGPADADGGMLTDLAHGIHTTRTKPSGQFVIDNVTRIDPIAPIEVVATLGTSMSSGPNEIDDSLHAVSLVIRPVGAISGVLSPRPTSETLPVVIAQSATNRRIVFSARVDEHGTFKIADVPADDYYIEIMSSGSVTRQRVSVNAGKKTELKFEMSK